MGAWDLGTLHVNPPLHVTIIPAKSWFVEFKGYVALSFLFNMIVLFRRVDELQICRKPPYQSF